MGRAAFEPWLTDEGLARIVEWCAEGRENKQIAKMIGIHPATLWDWRKKYATLDDAFKTGREKWFDIALPAVENAAYDLAVGYTYKETTRELKKQDDGSYALVVTKEVTKHQPANPVSNMYWMQNRAPDMWKDRRNMGQEQSDSGDTGVALIPEANRGKDDE